MKFSDQSTQGYLDIDGKKECFTLEPRKDQSQGKPFCIPVGTYKLELLPSAHFERLVPHILNVPDFDAIEIHPGNFVSDTHGCTVIGHVTYPNCVGKSDEAFDALMQKLSGQKDISITYLEE